MSSYCAQFYSQSAKEDHSHPIDVGSEGLRDRSTIHQCATQVHTITHLAFANY